MNVKKVIFGVLCAGMSTGLLGQGQPDGPLTQIMKGLGVVAIYYTTLALSIKTAADCRDYVEERKDKKLIQQISQNLDCLHDKLAVSVYCGEEVRYHNTGLLASIKSNTRWLQNVCSRKTHLRNAFEAHCQKAQERSKQAEILVHDPLAQYKVLSGYLVTMEATKKNQCKQWLAQQLHNNLCLSGAVTMYEDFDDSAALKRYLTQRAHTITDVAQLPNAVTDLVCSYAPNIQEQQRLSAAATKAYATQDDELYNLLKKNGAQLTDEDKIQAQFN